MVALTLASKLFSFRCTISLDKLFILVYSDFAMQHTSQLTDTLTVAAILSPLAIIFLILAMVTLGQVKQTLRNERGQFNGGN